MTLFYFVDENPFNPTVVSFDTFAVIVLCVLAFAFAGANKSYIKTKTLP